LTKKYKHSCGLYAVFHSERCQTPGDLKKYRDPGFLKEHPNVEIFYQGQWITCPIILAKVTDETDGTPYQKGERKILTLSTCYGTSKRMILQALNPVAGGMN